MAGAGGMRVDEWADGRTDGPVERADGGKAVGLSRRLGGLADVRAERASEWAIGRSDGRVVWVSRWAAGRAAGGRTDCLYHMAWIK